MLHSAFYGEHSLRQNDPISVRFDRRKALVYTLLFGCAMVVCLSRTNGVSATLIVIVVLSIPLAIAFSQLLRRGPVFVINDATFTDCKSGQVIPWDDIFEIYLRQRQGVFGVYHHLVFTIRSEPGGRDLNTLSSSTVPVQTLRRSIDLLSMGWSDIVALVQERLGKPIAVKHEAGLFGKTRSSS